MSLTGYFSATDNFSSAERQITVENLSNTGKQQLENDIRRAKAIEKEILNKLKVKSIQELNQRIKQYEQAVCPLSGSALKEAFIGYNQTKGYDIDELMKLLEREALEACMEEDIFNYEKALNILLNEVHTGSRKIRFSVNKIKTDSNGKGFIKTSNLSSAQKKALDNAIQAYNKTKPSQKIEKRVFTFELQEEGTGARFSWQTATDFLNPTEAKELQKVDSKQLGKMNAQVANEIVKNCGGDPHIKKIINHVLNTEPTAFFVGYNQNDIIGILGEIKAMYYLSKFLGIESIGRDIRWHGGTHEGADGQKPHRDVLLLDFGVQVKNTALDIGSNFSAYFTDASLETVLERLPNVEVKQLLTNFYTALAFNIPYYISKKGNAVSGQGRNSSPKMKNFITRRQNMLNMAPQIEKAFSAFASSLMYLAVDDISDLKNIDRNSLFLVAGKTFVLASEILEDLKRYIENNEPKHITIKYLNKSNIVSTFNSGVYERTIGEVAQDTVLTSSYNFKIGK